MQKRVLCRVIFNEETTPFFEAKNTPVCWNEIAGCLRKYPQLDQNGDQILIFENSFKQKIGEEIYKYASEQALMQLDWDYIHNKFKNRYPGYDIELIFLKVKLEYCQKKGLGEEHAKKRTLQQSSINMVIFWGILQ